MNLNRRSFLAGAAGATAAATISFEAAAASGVSAAPVSPPTDSLPPEMVHPEFRGFVRQLEDYSNKAPPLTQAGLAQMRRAPNPFPAKLRDDIPQERRTVRATGGHEIALYLVNARPGAARPAILHVHGGGYVMGSAADAVPALQAICAKLDCVAVSVDYRLAPETRWQGSVEDNYDGLVWLFDHAAELGADIKRIAVMGESAGGGHAALLAIAARDRGKVPVCFQCLVYPMLDDRTGSSVAPPPHVGSLLWTPERNRFGWESFLGAPPGGGHVPAAAVPARTRSLAGLPPAFIGVGSLDLFCIEDISYARRLIESGVPAELVVVPGVFHGFDNPMFPTRVGDWFTQTKIDALRRGFSIASP